MKYEMFTKIRGSNDHVIRIRVNKPRVRAYVALGSIFMILGYITYLWLISFISDNFRWYAYAPTKIISPLAVYAEGFVPTPTPTIHDQHEAYIKTKTHGDIILRIWNNESSEGKYPFLYCSKKGLDNEFGFGVTLKTPLCFNTFEASVDAVNAWFDRQLQDHTLAEALRIYSGSGITYINSFLNK